jgi:hypothetical protein
MNLSTASFVDLLSAYSSYSSSLSNSIADFTSNSRELSFSLSSFIDQLRHLMGCKNIFPNSGIYGGKKEGKSLTK